MHFLFRKEERAGYRGENRNPEKGVGEVKRTALCAFHPFTSKVPGVKEGGKKATSEKSRGHKRETIDFPGSFSSGHRAGRGGKIPDRL